MSPGLIDEAYRKAFPRSRALAERARAVCPGGVSQVSRELSPFPLAYERAEGARKWTVDGRELIDLVMGHGSLMFGHGHPAIRRAIDAQLARGSHFAGVSEREVELAERVRALVPSAELVRFAGTGSEAIHAALRLARAATGRARYLKFEGHYHGWHDDTFVALRPPYEQPLSAGLPTGEHVRAVVLPPNDLAAVSATLAARDDIGAIILEPAGGGHGTVPSSEAWVRGLRELASRHGAVLIFDEMVSGFRAGPGGYQRLIGVTPDLTTLGKALFGGLPGGALVGRASLMGLLAAQARPFVAHQGSWNAFPVACAAGVAALDLAADGGVQRALNDAGARLRADLNAVIARMGVAARVYGAFSHVHFRLGPWPYEGELPPPGRHREIALVPATYAAFRRAMSVHGVDLDHGNNLSSAHDERAHELVVEAFARALEMLVADGHVTAC